MFRLFWWLGSGVHALLTHAPSNRMITRLCCRPSLGGATMAALLSAASFYGAAVCTTLIDSGGPRWLYVFVLILILDGLKFFLAAPMVLLRRMRLRIAERRGLRSPKGSANLGYRSTAAHVS